jgi:LPS-assembly lipoprotein
MSLSEMLEPQAKLPLKRAALAMIGIMAMGMGGCFRPLYADSTTAVTGGSVKANLSAIEVMTIPDRLGHYLRNELVFDLDGSGIESPKRHLL